MEQLISQFDVYLQNSVLISLLIAFVGGLLTSLTPCIYPMIPITVGIIGHANVGGSRWHGFCLSLTYVLGMALTYAALGIFAVATGQFFGLVGSSPWTFLLVGSLILFFSLCMLDILRMPVFAPSWTRRKLGLMGIFLAGMSSALVAGPCTTPVLGSLLAYMTATTTNLLFGGFLFFIFSLGMGVLLLGVGTFSSFITALPRSGAWMVTIKRAMGVCMIALAVYFYHKAWVYFS